MSVYLVDYSEKAIAVFGPIDTLINLRDHLEQLGSANSFLTNPKTGKREAGFTFPKTRKAQVQKILDGVESLKEVAEEDKLKKTTTSRPMSAKPVSDFLLTKEMYLALISRIEKLENDNTILTNFIEQNNLKTPPKPIKKETLNAPSKKINIKFDESEEEEEEEEEKPKKSFLKFN
jgi:hypothetical protein